MRTPTKSAKPYSLTIIIFGPRRPPKLIVMMMPAVLMTAAVRPTARLAAARSLHPFSRNSAMRSMRNTS